MRKIVQIGSYLTNNETRVYAICDDATIWILEGNFHHGTLGWNKWLLPDIPQDAEKTESNQAGITPQMANEINKLLGECNLGIDKETLIGGRLRHDRSDMLERASGIARKLICIKCKGDRFFVGQGSYITVIKCPTCGWERDIHNG